MHHSRIGVFLLDFPAGDYETTQQFWGAVVGHEAEPEEGDVDYAALMTLGPVKLETQRTGSGTPPRVHLDIETDDVAAEVARLVGLGASIDIEHEHFTVMRDPSAMVFCVVPVQTGEHFAPHATEWP